MMNWPKSPINVVIFLVAERSRTAGEKDNDVLRKVSSRLSRIGMGEIRLMGKRI